MYRIISKMNNMSSKLPSYDTMDLKSELEKDINLINVKLYKKIQDTKETNINIIFTSYLSELYDELKTSLEQNLTLREKKNEEAYNMKMKDLLNIIGQDVDISFLNQTLNLTPNKFTNDEYNKLKLDNDNLLLENERLRKENDNLKLNNEKIEKYKKIIDTISNGVDLDFLCKKN